MLTVGREIDTAAIEALYKEIDKQRKRNYVDLSIPVSIKFLGFGALSSFFQLLLTWRRLENCGRLILNSKDIREISSDDVEASIKQYYGFIASVLAWEKGIINKNGNDVKALFKEPNAEYAYLLQKAEFEKSARGDSVLFPFFDHMDVSRGLLPIIYKSGVLQDEKEFGNLTERLIDIVTKNNAIHRKKFQSIKESINAVLFELFDNTNKWAKKSFTGRMLNPSVRGVYGKFYKLELKNIKSYSNSSGLKKYFKKIQENNVFEFEGEQLKYIVFMELTVFDGGSGLVQRFVGKDLDEMTLNEEYSKLLECLKKHTTSHKDFGDFENRGLGLHRIMELLDDAHGFLKIRSGRMLLYRDFYTYPFFDKAGDPNYWLLDWDLDGTKPSDRPKSEGTLITMLIPIARTIKIRK